MPAIVIFVSVALIAVVKVEHVLHTNNQRVRMVPIRINPSKDPGRGQTVIKVVVFFKV